MFRALHHCRTDGFLLLIFGRTFKCYLFGEVHLLDLSKLGLDRGLQSENLGSDGYHLLLRNRHGLFDAVARNTVEF